MAHPTSLSGSNSSDCTRKNEWLARSRHVQSEDPLDQMPRLSKRLQNSVLLKREDLQPVFSFKLRGAYNKMAGLSRAALDRGVIAPRLETMPKESRCRPSC